MPEVSAGLDAKQLTWLVVALAVGVFAGVMLKPLIKPCGCGE